MKSRHLRVGKGRSARFTRGIIGKLFLFNGGYEMNDLIKENRNKVNREVNEFWRIQNEIEDDFTSLAVKLDEDASEVIRKALPSGMRNDWKESLRIMQDSYKPLRLRLEALDTAITMLEFTEFILKDNEEQ